MSNSQLPKLQLKFVDFWHDFDPLDNVLTNLLRKKYELVFDGEPDFIFYSNFGTTYKRYNCKKVLFSGENVLSNFRGCHYGMAMDYLPWKRYQRYPLCRYGIDLIDLQNKLDAGQVLSAKTKFCNFLYTNPRGSKRNRFFEKLSRYKRIDAAGKHLNNMGSELAYGHQTKLKFFSSYKFSISFENTSFPGYTTEKIVHPMVANSMPIYWGNPLVWKDFNTRSFINVHDFSNLDDVVERVIELDRNDDLYMECFKQPWLLPHQHELFAEEHFFNFIKRVIETPFSYKDRLSNSVFYAYHYLRKIFAKSYDACMQNYGIR